MLDEAVKIGSILGDVSQLVLGAFAVTLSVVAIKYKRQEIFRTELARAQFVEVGKIRDTLSQIWFDIYYVSNFKSQLDTMGWSLKQFEEYCPEEWDQFQRYKNYSIEIFNKFMTPGYYLFPKWLEENTITGHFELMEKFAPFTIIATGKHDHDTIMEYQNSISQLVAKIDKLLVDNS